MPCRDPEFSPTELALNDVIQVFLELEKGKTPHESCWPDCKIDGQNVRINQENLDNLTEFCCTTLKAKTTEEIEKLSTFTQCWWIMHQAHDKIREIKEKARR